MARRPASPAAPSLRPWWERLKLIGALLLLGLGLRACVAETALVRDVAMSPSLLPGDWVLVSRLGRGDLSRPSRRGDVVLVVTPPQLDRPDDPTPEAVRRVVAVGGDTVHMRAGLLHLNGVAQRQGYAAADMRRGRAGPGTAAGDAGADALRLSGDSLLRWQGAWALRASRFGTAPLRPTRDSWGPLVVPAGHVFVLGDRRDEARDARHFGFVPRGSIRGRVVRVLLSPELVPGAAPVPRGVRIARTGLAVR